MRFTLIILLTTLTQQLSAQETGEMDFLAREYFISKVTKAVGQYGVGHPVEKIYIHFDRQLYFVTDTAWFNIYVVDSKLKPASNSIAVFVDWIHEDGTLVKHQQFQIVNGAAAGSLAFLENPPGLYHVRAYTTLMTKETPEYLFHAKLNLVNPSKPDDVSRASGLNPDSVDLQFFPEGGSLIEGLESQVAFRVTDVRGKGTDLVAQLLDDLSQPVASVRSAHKGMGILTLKPEKDRSYQMVWNNKIFQLPKSLTSGAVMRVNATLPDFIEVKIQVSDDLIPGKYYLIGQAQNNICFRDMFTLTGPNVVLQLPKKSLPPGILQLTLFDENAIPMCERMVFTHPKADLQLSMKFDKSVYSPREVVSLKIDVTDKNGLPVQANLSVAITDAAFAKRNIMSENIRTQLLLQSDLRGNIEDPGWYFESVNQDKVAALDLVMLTHGWRKFTWEKVLTQEADENAYAREKGISVFGRVVAGPRSRPVQAAGITLITNFNHETKTFIATSDQEGNFRIDDMMFDDSTRFVWQIRDKKGGQIDAQVIFTAPRVPPVNLVNLPKSASVQNDVPINEIVSRMHATGAWDSYKFKMLEEVEIRGEKIENSPRSARDILPEDYHRYSMKPTPQESVNYTDVTHMIRDKFPNVTFIGAGMNLDVRIRGYNKVMMKKEMSPLILLDGQIILSDSLHQGGVYHALNIIPVSEIEKIEVISGAAASIYGARAGSGVIALYSKGRSGKAIVDKTGPGKGVLKVVPPGFEWPRTFYHPKYDSIQSPATPDHRMTLFWSPQIKTDGSGSAHVEFYNSDIAKSFQVVIEGMANGIPLSGINK